jgi:hypothetical protein
MKINRNDPCHCGSGKKYKKCCLEKDQKMQRSQQVQKPFEDPNQLPEPEDLLKSLLPEESPQSAKPDRAKDPDPHTEALDARWEEFLEQDYEGQIAIFLKTLEEPELMDEEMAFEMLNEIYHKAAEFHQYHRYDALVEQLRERLPKVYHENAPYYLENCISNAVITGRFDRIPVLMDELTLLAHKDIDIFNKVVDQLTYYGQLSVLVQAFETAWPRVKKSPHIVPWGVDEFAVKTVKFLIFDYLEQHGADPSGHPELFERIKSNSELEPERITPRWSRQDFTFDVKLRSRDEGGKAIQLPEKVQQNLFDISLDFQGYLWREKNVSLTKSEPGREELVTYLTKRLAGDLEPHKSMLEAALYPDRPGPKKRSPEFYLSGDDDSLHWFCPDRKTLDAFLARFFDIIGAFPYRGVTFFEMIPSWLHFLEMQQLISASVRRKTLRDLHELRAQLLSILRKTNFDPALQSAIENWEKE